MLKNNFVGEGTAYDGDVSSVYYPQQTRKKAQAKLTNTNHAYNSTQPLSMLALDFANSLKNVNVMNQYETFSPKQAN